MLKKKLNDQCQYEDKFDSQLEKYEIMKNKANSALIVRTNLLNKMISFENMALLKNETEIFEKNKLYQELEDHVQLIKLETADLDYKLGLIEDDIKKTERTIWEYKAKARYLLPERNNLIKYYYVSQIKLTKIFKSLGVNSVEELMQFFNKEKYIYQSNYTLFNNLNKEIVDLNIILTTYEKDQKKIEFHLRSKEFREMMSGDYKSDMEVNNLEIALKETKITIEEQVEKLAKIGKIFIKLKRDFLNYDKTLIFVKKCIIDVHNLKFKEKDNASNSKHSVSKDASHQSMINIKEKNIIESSKTIRNYANSINMLPNDSEWSKEQGK